MRNQIAFSESFWRGKRVFLTGHTGFKGSWLSLWLQNWGVDLTGYALQPPTQPSLFEEASVGQKMNSVIGDVRDYRALHSAMHEARPEIIIHMAAQPLVRYSYNHPVETFDVNVMGTVHVLEAARTLSGLKMFLIVTSDKCYENQERAEGYSEHEPMGGYDPYSSSKGCAELVTASYRKSFFNPGKYEEHGVCVATARAGNVIGGGDWAEDRLIPDFYRALNKREKVVIRNPHAIRPWQHVLEPLSGYLYLCEAGYKMGPPFAESFNFGPHDEDAKSVGWIVEEVVKQNPGAPGFEIDAKTSQPHEAHYLKLKCEKAARQLGWEPQWTLEKALRQIADWNQSYMLGRGESRAITLKQIQDYITTSKNRVVC